MILERQNSYGLSFLEDKFKSFDFLNLTILKDLQILKSKLNVNSESHLTKANELANKIEEKTEEIAETLSKMEDKLHQSGINDWEHSNFLQQMNLTLHEVFETIKDNQDSEARINDNLTKEISHVNDNLDEKADGLLKQIETFRILVEEIELGYKSSSNETAFLGEKLNNLNETFSQKILEETNRSISYSEELKKDLASTYDEKIESLNNKIQNVSVQAKNNFEAQLQEMKTQLDDIEKKVESLNCGK